MLNDKPLVSVIMGAYNAERVIFDSVLSVLSQTYKNVELIVINDGSTDKTESILSNINDDRLRIINQKNCGLTKSLNRAIREANGDFIARQDADDLSIVTRLEEQVNHLIKKPHIKLLGSSTFVSNKKGIFNEIYHYPSSMSDIRSAIYQYNPFVHGSVIIDTKTLKDAGGYNENYKYVQDYELWSRLVHEVPVENLDKPLYARLRGYDCSEVTVDKTEYVEKIKNNIKPSSYKTDEVTQIKSESIYPLMSLFSNKNNKLIRDTYRAIASYAVNHNLSNAYRYKRCLIY